MVKHMVNHKEKGKEAQKKKGEKRVAVKLVKKKWLRSCTLRGVSMWSVFIALFMVFSVMVVGVPLPGCQKDAAFTKGGRPGRRSYQRDQGDRGRGCEKKRLIA